MSLFLFPTSASWNADAMAELKLTVLDQEVVTLR